MTLVLIIFFFPWDLEKIYSPLTLKENNDLEHKEEKQQMCTSSLRKASEQQTQIPHIQAHNLFKNKPTATNSLALNTNTLGLRTKRCSKLQLNSQYFPPSTPMYFLYFF